MTTRRTRRRPCAGILKHSGGKAGAYEREEEKMYSNYPVMIPDRPGKITIKKRNASEYIQYEVGRKYDPVRKYNLPDRKLIGIRIPSIPEMMLPNENYYRYFKGEETMDEEQKKTAKAFGTKKTRFIMLRELFEQLYYEFQIQSRKKPDEVVNPYKVQKINSILGPLRELMAGEDYTQYLDLIEASEDETGPGGQTFSDVALMLTQYKGAIKRFNSERM